MLTRSTPLTTLNRFSELLLNHSKGFNRPNLFKSPQSCTQFHVHTRTVSIPARCLYSREASTKNVENENTADQFDYNVITNGDKELEHKLKVIMLETEVLRQDGLKVPPQEFLDVEKWRELLKLSSKSARKNYLSFLFKLSKTKENRKAKKLERQQEFQEFKASQPKNTKPLTVEEHAQQYGLQHNSMFIRISDTTMHRMYNNRLIQSMQFGEKIVIDCGYDKNMTRRENLNCAKQLMFLFAENRSHDEPFDVHYCNLNRSSDLGKQFKKYIPTMDDLEFPINVHEQNYLSLFPKEKLVYLTPHCKEEMTQYDPDLIYIVGGIVDKINNEPLSLAKAKREGLKMLKFPLDRYLSWGAGSGKSLTLNHCVAILLDLKKTGNWEYSLRHVPKRKLADTYVRKPNSYDTEKRRRKTSYSLGNIF